MFDFLSRWKNKDEETRSLGPNAWLTMNGKSSSAYDSDGTPLSIATAYSCIRLISTSVSLSQIKYFQVTDEGNKELTNNRLTKLMKKPTKNMTASKWKSFMITNLKTFGNAYAHIIRDSYGKPIELKPLANDQVSVMYLYNDDLTHYYQVTNNQKKTIKVDMEDMIHLFDFSINGVEGLNPIQKHKLLFESAKGQNEYHKEFIKNSANPSGVIETEKKLSKEAVNDLRDNFSSKFSGTKNAGKTPVLPEGLKYRQLNVMSPTDTDYIAGAKFTQENMAMIYNVPMSMLGGTSTTTYSNAEQDSIKFQRYTLAPIEEMFAQELGLKLINFYNESDTFFEFVTDNVKSVSFADKANVISQLKREGIITPNEAREYYDKNAMPNGDELIIQINTAPQNLVEEQMEASIEQTKTPEPAPEPVVEKPDDEDQIEDLKRSIHKLKSQIGRLKK